MLNIFELNRKKDEREMKKYNIYNQVLSKCHVRIQLSSDRNQQDCIYTLPKFLSGLPSYDNIKCAEYIIDNLRRNGFKVAYTYPNLLYISWKHIPSNVTNPYVQKLETDMIINPYRDFSKDIRMISNMTMEPSSPRYHNIISEESNQYDNRVITKPYKF